MFEIQQLLFDLLSVNWFDYKIVKYNPKKIVNAYYKPEKIYCIFRLLVKLDKRQQNIIHQILEMQLYLDLDEFYYI